MTAYRAIRAMILLAAIPAAATPVPAQAPVPGPPRAESLEQAWEAAMAVDRQLDAERWNLSAARKRRSAAEAQRWFGADVDASYTLRSDEPTVQLRAPGPTSYLVPLMQDHSVAGRAAVDLPLYTSGRVARSIGAASAETVAAGLQYEDARADLKMEVAEVFVAVLRAEQELNVRETAVRSLDAHRRDVESRFEHQQVPENDLLAARVALADARQRAIEAHNALDVARASYNRHLGRPLTQPFRLQAVRRSAPTEALEELTALAQRNRRQLGRLSAQAEALRHQAEALRAAARPQVHMRGEYQFEENRYRRPQGIAAMGVGVSWNLFDAGRTGYEAASLDDQAERLLNLRADLQSRIALDVRRRWLEVRQTRQRLEVTPQAIEQAEENLRILRRRYALGTAMYTEVLDAETLRTQAYRNHYHAAYDAVLAALRLEHATGRL
ncbi:MAG: TolC family protein [Thermoguttaceae bacterium]